MQLTSLGKSIIIMLLLAIFIGMFLLLFKYPNKIGSLYATIKHPDPETAIKLNYFYKIHLFSTIGIFPIVLYNAIYTSMGIALFTAAFQVYFIFNLFLLKKGKLNLVLFIVILVVYPLQVLLLLIDGPGFSITLNIIAIFIVVDYTSTSFKLRLFNAIMAVATYITYTVLLYKILNQFSEEKMIGDLISGITSICLIYINIYLFRKDTETYKKGKQKSEQFLQQIADLNPHYIFAKNNEGAFTYLNQSFANIWGMSIQDMLGKKLSDLFPNSSFSKAIQTNDNRIFSQQLESDIVEEVLLNKNGKHLILETIKTTIYDDNGQAIGLLSVATNVTEKKKALNELAAREQRYRSIFENNQSGIIMEKEDIFQKCNDAFCKMTGYSREEIIGKKVTDILYFEDYAKSVFIAKTLKKVPNVGFEHRFIRKDGSFGYAVINVTRLSDKAGNLIENIATITDISSLKVAENALRERESYYKSLFHNSPLGFAILDTEKTKRPIECNEKFLEMMDISISDFMGTNMLDASPIKQADGSSSKDKLHELMTLYHKNWTTISFEWQFKKPSKEIFWTQVIFTPIFLKEQKFTLVIIKDLSQIKEKEHIILAQVNTLNKKNEELHKYINSNMQLENFAYLASHDLKAPMRSIVGFSQLLQNSAKEKLNGEEHEYLNFVIGATQNMKALIEDLLNYSRVNTQNRKISTINIAEVVQVVVSEIQVNIIEKKADIVMDNLPTAIKGDFTQLRQLFQNLIANAIKFNKPNLPPKVTITAKEQANNWLFSVTDNGIGISPDYHQRIFLLFRKLHNSTEYEGTGIGLALCKKIVEQHEGKIWVESEQEVGTTFYFTINKNLTAQT